MRGDVLKENIIEPNALGVKCLRQCTVAKQVCIFDLSSLMKSKLMPSLVHEDDEEEETSTENTDPLPEKLKNSVVGFSFDMVFCLLLMIKCVDQKKYLYFAERNFAVRSRCLYPRFSFDLCSYCQHCFPVSKGEVLFKRGS